MINIKIEISEYIIDAIRDAKEYLENVPDDRCNSCMSWQREDEVLEILNDLLKKMDQQVSFKKILSNK